MQPILAKFHNMKRSHIIILIGIAVVIAGLLAYSADFSTYDSINSCLLYTSDAADERSSVDLGGRRIIKKKKSI